MLALRTPAASRLALVLALAVGAGISIGRLWGDQFLGRADMVAHLRFALSASREIAEGRLILTFLNDAPVGFQPFFLDYSVVPAFLAGVFKVVLGVSAYESVLLTFGLFFVVAGVGVALVCQYLRVGFPVTTVAACAYAFSPYAFDNFFARGALPEFSANALLPAALWAFLRCYASRGRHGFVAAVGATAALVLTHKVQLPWFLVGFGLLVVLVGLRPGRSLHKRSRRVVIRSLPLAGAMLLGTAICAPYWLEAYLSISHLIIAKFIGSHYEGLTQGLRIFWPFYQEAPGATGTTLALQLGAPAVVGIGLGCLLWRRGLPLAISAVALASALMVAAGPVVWQLVPPILVAVQFPYRLLAQSTLFGVLGLALVIHKLPRRWRQMQAPYILLFAAHLVVLSTAIQFIHPLPQPPYPPSTLFEDDARIETVLAMDYVQFPDSLLETILASPMSGFEPGFAAVEAHLADRFYGRDLSSEAGDVSVQRDQVDITGNTARTVIVAVEPTIFVLPLQFSPYLRISESDERRQSPSALAVQNVDGRAAITLASGTHRLQLDREIAPLATRLSAVGWIALALVVLTSWIRFRLAQRGLVALLLRPASQVEATQL